MRSKTKREQTNNGLKKLSYKWNRSDEVKREPWFIHRWEVFFVFLIVGILLIINMLPQWVTENSKNILGQDGEYHPLLSHPWKQSIVYQNIAMVLTVVLALWMIFFTEMGRYLGKYGSAIFVMMPSFIWLLADRSNGDMTKIIFEAERTIAWATFWVFIAIFGLFLIKMVVKFLTYEFNGNSNSKYIEWRIEFTSSLINRMFFMLLNFCAIFIIASRLMTYGSYTLGLAVDEAGTNHSAGLGDKDKFVYFIAMVAVATSFLLVLVGIIQKFDWKTQRKLVEESLATKEVHDSVSKELNSKYLSLDRALKTREIKLNEIKKHKNKEETIILTMEIQALKKEFKKAKKMKEKQKKKGGV